MKRSDHPSGRFLLITSPLLAPQLLMTHAPEIWELDHWMQTLDNNTTTNNSQSLGREGIWSKRNYEADLVFFKRILKSVWGFGGSQWKVS